MLDVLLSHGIWTEMVLVEHEKTPTGKLDDFQETYYGMIMVLLPTVSYVILSKRSRNCQLTITALHKQFSSC
jgi:hypothetical protein